MGFAFNDLQAERLQAVCSVRVRRYTRYDGSNLSLSKIEKLAARYNETLHDAERTESRLRTSAASTCYGHVSAHGSRVKGVPGPGS